MTGAWVVAREDDGPWLISRDGVVVETVRGHYDASEVLAVAEGLAGEALAWRLIGGGFESVGGVR